VTFALDASQERAVELMLKARLGIVTGGPGTGKTTCLRTALDRMDARGVTYALASPTGKAAKRITETTGREARTIHRLLEFHPAEGFRRNRDNPIDADVVLIDESSMIDVDLGAALFKAIAPSSRLILIGDANQLPSVGAGRIFGDLVDAEAVPTARLDTLHRSAAESWIAVNAPRVLAGAMPSLKTCRDFRFIPAADAREVLPIVKKLVTVIAPKELDAEPMVLIPQRPGPAGITAANRMLQAALNPRRGNELTLGSGEEHELRVGDRVIQTKNDYELEVFNGEVGQIGMIDSDGAVQVDFGDRVVRYRIDQAGSIELAYALTVHRSQGSEFPWVVVVCHSSQSFILNRQLLYTAITRAKKGVVLIGDEKGLRAALKTNAARRNTTLIERMRGELEPAEDNDQSAGGAPR
jgi:exodeoxyribonuclease V alpha subunit